MTIPLYSTNPELQAAFKAGKAFSDGRKYARKTWVYLAFDAEILPEGFDWKTNKQGKRYLTDGQNPFLEVTDKFSEGVCNNTINQIKNATSSKEIRNALKSNARAMRGYIMRDFGNDEQRPVFIDGSTVAEVAKHYVKNETGAKLEVQRRNAIKQVEIMKNIVQHLSTGVAISSSKDGHWRQNTGSNATKQVKGKTVPHHPDDMFYIVGAHIKDGNGVSRVEFDLKAKKDLQQSGKVKGKIVFYNMSFKGKQGNATKEKVLKAEAVQYGNKASVDFFNK